MSLPGEFDASQSEIVRKYDEKQSRAVPRQLGSWPERHIYDRHTSDQVPKCPDTLVHNRLAHASETYGQIENRVNMDCAETSYFI